MAQRLIVSSENESIHIMNVVGKAKLIYLLLYVVAKITIAWSISYLSFKQLPRNSSSS